MVRPQRIAPAFCATLFPFGFTFSASAQQRYPVESRSEWQAEGKYTKYKGIRGTLTDAVEFNTDPTSGYNRGNTKGEYWFEGWLTEMGGSNENLLECRNSVRGPALRIFRRRFGPGPYLIIA